MHDACYQRILPLALTGFICAAALGCAGSPRAQSASIVPDDEEAILYDCAVASTAAEGYGLNGADFSLRHFRTTWEDDGEGGRVRLRALVYTSETRGPGLDLSREREVMRDGEWDAAGRDSGASAQIDAVLAGVRSCWSAQSVHGDFGQR
ncbi:MAG: hypothetical protein ACI81R_000534 [Bradymonadia bacterium]